MSQVSPILRRGQTGYFHWCPACERMHPIPDGWTFNGSLTHPTFTPSLKQTSIRWSGGIDPSGLGLGERQELICHYFIVDGKIQFCFDSWHQRSDIVAMPAIPLHLSDRQK